MNFLKSALKVSFLVFIISFLIIMIMILKWGMPGMSSEIPWYNLTETYIKKWDYSIWKQKFQYNICHEKEGCLNWKILWLKEKEDKIYMYIKINYSKWGSFDEKTWEIEVKNYDFYLYNRKKYIIVNDINELPTFWYLSWNKLEFYSEKDLSKLPEEQQNTFREIKKNPTIIINGKDYTK